MKGSLFLFHWNDSEAEAHAESLRSRGWLVDYESRDGARGVRFVKTNLPEAVLISLDRTPSHGRAVAGSLLSAKATSSLITLFTGDNQQVIARARREYPSIEAVSWKDLHQVLSKQLTTKTLLHIETGHAIVQGGRLYYEITGAGHPLLFIHAGVADLSMWDAQFTALAPYFRVIRFDCRGFGRSTTESVPYSNSQDIIDLLDHIGIERAFLLGCSRGGYIALDFSIAHPERVAALIPVASGVSGYEHQPDDTPKAQAEYQAFVRMDELYSQGDFPTLNELEVRMWADGPGQPEGRVLPSIRSLVRRLNMVNLTRQDGVSVPQPLDPPAIERLREIQVPTLVIVGDLDTSGTLRVAELLAQRIPGAHLLVYPNVAHMVNLEAPRRFTHDVREFITPLS